MIPSILDQSLCMFPGISPEAEVEFRRMGVVSARQFAQSADRYLSRKKAERVREFWHRWEKALSLELVDMQLSAFPCGHRVRALFDLWRKAVFLDIETDGTTGNPLVTCITTLRDGDLKTFVRGRNLNDFLDVWKQALEGLVVSFNGKRFDVPMLQREFALSTLPPHVDLMDEAAHFGLRGGLKSIENIIGIVRPESDCRDGQDAVDFWQKYAATQSEEVLQTLISYNRYDVLALPILANVVLKKSLENTCIVHA